MKENMRKCLKCGISPVIDPSIILHRFPRPGRTNILRCELWAKYCFPDEEWSCPKFQMKLWTKHRMLCSRHFSEFAYIDSSKKKLLKHATPSDENMAVYFSNELLSQPVPGPSSAFKDITNLAKENTSFVKPGPSSLLQGTDNIARDVAACKSVIQNRMSDHSYCRSFGNSQSHSKDISLRYNKCKKYIQKICKLRSVIKNMKKKQMITSLVEDETIQKLSNKISPSFALLLQGELQNFKKKLLGRRWTTELKILALRLYKRSPTCYRLMRRVFCLPSPGTLKSLLGRFKINVGMNNNIMKVIQGFAKNQNKSDNAYTLLFDEMAIKRHLHYNMKDDCIDGYQDHGTHGRSPEVATAALVFMITGIRKQVKQPIAYYLSGSHVTADRLAVIIKEVVSCCLTCDINIMAIVCDLDGVNRRALKILGATQEKPSLVINKKEIVSIFDVPHLLKCFRNLFLKYNISCTVDINNTSGIGVAKWSHIEDFYNLDSSNPNFVFAPTLRRDHLGPNSKQKMKVNLAAQVLSHTVAAGMLAKIAQGELTAEAIVTANVVSNMDKLFDLLNSDNPDRRRGKPYATNMTEKSPHLDFFRKMKSFFQNMNFIGSHSAPPSKEGWIWTLNGMEMLWSTIKQNTDVKSLSTRRLQQDPLENLFGCIRGNCGSNSNPTAGQFVAGFKTAVLSSLSHISTGNCEADNNICIINNFKFLLTSEELPKTVVINTDRVPLLSNMVSAVENSLVETICEDAGEVQACAYVCGFLLKNQKLNETCKTCKSIFTSCESITLHNFVTNKEYYTECKKSLKYASKDFVQCVETCATLINELLIQNSHKNYIKKDVIEKLNNNTCFNFLEECIPHKVENIQYINNSVLYICIKRFCVLKNRNFAQMASMSALKKKINILQHR